MRLAELLVTPALAEGTVISPGDPDAAVEELYVGETAGEVAQASRDCVLVLTRAGAAGVRSFRLDVLMARATQVGVRAVVLPSAVSPLPKPNKDLAGAVCVIAVEPAVSLGRLVVALARQLASQDSAVVQRLRDTSSALGRLDGDGRRMGSALEAELVAILSAAGMSVDLADVSEPVPAGFVSVPADEGRQWIAQPETLPSDAVRLLVHAANSRLLAAQTESAAPDRTLAALLSEMLSGDATLDRELRFRARTLGFRVDGWHLVLALETRGEADEDRDVDRVRLEQTVTRVALRELQGESVNWSWTHRGASLIFVRTWSRQPTETQIAEAVGAAHAAHVAVCASLGPSAGLFAGLGKPHPHIDGLRRAGSQARSAVRHAQNRSARSMVTFDEFGLDEALVDWYLSDGASSTAAARLAPITSLPRGKGEPLLHTLRVYLDHQGSVSETARALFMHRNTVRYRLDQIKSLLGSDLGDPDERLILHLACRGWALTRARGADRQPRTSAVRGAPDTSHRS